MQLPVADLYDLVVDLAFELPAYVSLAAALACALLLPLYFSQRRDLERLHAWMEREPGHPAGGHRRERGAPGSGRDGAGGPASAPEQRAERLSGQASRRSPRRPPGRPAGDAGRPPTPAAGLLRRSE